MKMPDHITDEQVPNDPADQPDAEEPRCEDCGKLGEFDITGRCPECLDEWRRESAELIRSQLMEACMDIARGSPS